MKKTVLITGASRGIGFSLAKKFLKNDYHVIGTSRNGEISDFENNSFQPFPLDLSSIQSIKSFENQMVINRIKIDFLINNAGIGPDLDYKLPEEESFKQTFEVNVIGTIFLTELIIPYLNIGGKVINISSKMGSIGLCKLTDSVAYRMSKTSLNMYTKILANRLLNKYKVTAVHPGWVKTTISKSNINGRLSTDESAKGIFDYIISGFKTGTFWNVENQSEIEW